MGSKTGDDPHNISDNQTEPHTTLDVPKPLTTQQEDLHPIKIEDSSSDLKSSRSFTSSSNHYITEKQRFYGRIFTMGFAVTVMLLAQFSVPDNEVKCIVDNFFVMLEPLTKWFNDDPTHVWFRNALQILCSLLMDITFLLTFGYWMFRGKSSRLVVSLGIFYVMRALI